jgi:hypothetical protein
MWAFPRCSWNMLHISIASRGRFKYWKRSPTTHTNSTIVIQRRRESPSSLIAWPGCTLHGQYTSLHHHGLLAFTWSASFSSHICRPGTAYGGSQCNVRRGKSKRPMPHSLSNWCSVTFCIWPCVTYGKVAVCGGETPIGSKAIAVIFCKSIVTATACPDTDAVPSLQMPPGGGGSFSAVHGWVSTTIITVAQRCFRSKQLCNHPCRFSFV